MKQVNVIKVFIASPGDVKDDRTSLINTINGFNEPNNQFSNSGFQFEIADWKDVAPDAGRPEDVILRQLFKDVDIFIGILWVRFGTSTGEINQITGAHFESGTEEEFITAYQLCKSRGYPRILFYYCQRDCPVKTDPNQLKKVQNFVRELEPGGIYSSLYQTYQSPEELAKRCQSDFNRVIFIDEDFVRPKKHQLCIDDLLDKEKLLHIYSCKDYKERKSLCDKFFESLKNGGDVVVLVNSGIVKFHIGELNEAKKDLEKAKNIIESFDDNLKKVHKITRGYCLQWLGIIQRTYGNLEEAETLHKKAKKIAIDVGDKLLEAHAHANLGAVVLWRDGYKPSEVLQFWNEAFRNSKIANDTYWQIHFGIDVEYMKFLDVKYQPENQHKRLYNNSLNELITWIRLAWRNGYKEHIARGIMNQGNVMFALEDYNESERLYKDALEKAKEIGANRLIWRTNHNIGNVYRKQGYNNAAKNKYEDAIEDLKREVEKESEKVKTIHDKKDPLRSMLILTLDLDKKEEAIKKAQDYKKVFAVDFLTDDEKDIDLNKLKKEALVQFDCKVH